ncbi:MAG: c-type cytochrome [Rhodothermales bacterium]|nr:c-type cytochrome [Rhodothermales bacterium]MBO6780919.1 c-type cytochrome [Rhodothermales bacterium]
MKLAAPVSILALALISAPAQSPPSSLDASASDSLSFGQRVFETSCASCHSVDPPPNLAPPMRMVLKHYLEAEIEDPWGAIKAWVTAPDSARSALPAHAIERFGLMPPLPWPESHLDSLIVYLQQVAAEPMPQHGGHGPGMRHGDGQGMQHGTPPDSTRGTMRHHKNS